MLVVHPFFTRTSLSRSLYSSAAGGIFCGLSETDTGCSFVDCQRPNQITFLCTLRGRRRWFLWIDWCDGKDKPWESRRCKRSRACVAVVPYRSKDNVPIFNLCQKCQANVKYTRNKKCQSAHGGGPHLECRVTHQLMIQTLY